MDSKKLELQEQILEGALRVYVRDGIKFTMDDLAKELHISKKTIYKIFEDKESLMRGMAVMCFDEVKKLQSDIYNREDLTLEDKLKALLSAMPNVYDEVDFSLMYELKDKYPKVFKEVEFRLESGWEKTFDVFNRGIEEGIFNEFSFQTFKFMYTSTLENFFKYDFLSANNMTYQDGLKEVADILINGIIKK